MKKLVLLLLLLFFTLGSLFSQQFSWQWYKNLHDSNLQTVNDIIVDSARGYVYAVGTFEGSLSSDFTAGGNSVNSRGNKDGFVAQFDLLGNCNWSFSIGGDEDDEMNAIDIDLTTGDVYVVGYGSLYSGFFMSNNDLKFGDAQGNYVSHGNWSDGGREKDIIAVKYNFNGNFQWSQVDGSRKTDIATDVTVIQGMDRIVYTGFFKSSSNPGYNFELGGGTDIDPGNSNKHLFIIARDKTVGARIWRGYAQNDSQEGLAISNDGSNVYFSGTYKNQLDIEIDLGSNSLANQGTLANSSSSMNSIYYSKLNALTGTPFWLKSISSPNEDQLGDIVINNNKIYIGGGIGNNASFDGSPLFSTTSGLTMFISEHDLNGNYIRNIIEQNMSSAPRSMVKTLDFSSDYLVAGGFTTGSILFNNQSSETLTSAGQADGFVAYYKPVTFGYIGRKHIFGNANNFVNSISTLDRDIYVGGQYGGGANLDSDIQMANVGGESGFLSFLEFQCSTSLTYSTNNSCSEAAMMSPVYTPTGGSFSYLGGSTLNLNSTSGLVDPFQSQGGSYSIVYADLTGCTDTFDLTIVAGLPPQFTSCPTDYTITTSGSNCGATYLYTTPANSTDCGSNIVTQSDGTGYVSGDEFPVGTTLQEFVVSDGYNPNDTCRFTVTVVDNTPPSFSGCPSSDVVVYSGTNSCSETVDYGTIFATDACGILTEVLTTGLVNNSLFPLDTTPIIITATDIHNNQSTCSFNVIVKDTIAPVFTICPSINDTVKYYTSDSDCQAEISFSSLNATDNCGARVFQSYGTQSGNFQVPSNSYYREFTAIDSSGNFSVCRVNYAVLDTIAPTIVCPTDTILDADISSCTANYSYSSPYVGDNCTLFTPSANQIDISGFSSGDNYPIGITNQAFQIQDIYGNIATCNFTVTVNNVTDAGEFTGVLDGVCSDAGLIDLSQYVDASLNGLWVGNGIVVDSFLASPSVVGTNEVLYIVGGTSCSDTVVHQIEVYDFVAQAGADDSLCGLSFQLGANLVSGTSQSWLQQYTESYQSLTDSNSVVTVGASGIYNFVWQVEKNQCLKTDTVEVVFYEQPISDAGYDQTVEENEVELNGALNSGIGYWTIVSSDGTIEDSLLENTMVTNLNLGLNTFEWTVENGLCPVSVDLVRIFYDYLQIPNAFTPNGDGINDLFYIVGFDLQSEAELTIIDRWGEKIFYTNDVGEYWDGTYKGKDMVADTYFYILYIRGKELTGYIELRR